MLKGDQDAVLNINSSELPLRLKNIFRLVDALPESARRNAVKLYSDDFDALAQFCKSRYSRQTMDVVRYRGLRIEKI